MARGWLAVAPKAAGWLDARDFGEGFRLKKVGGGGGGGRGLWECFVRLSIVFLYQFEIGFYFANSYLYIFC